jgi:hypothetical protein
MSRTTAVAALLVSLVLLAGCSEEKTPGQATNSDPTASTPADAPPTETEEPASPASPTEPCALLPGTSVAEQLGVEEVAASPVPEQSTEDGAKVYLCEYADGAEPLGALTISVHEGNQIDAPAMIDAVKGNYTAPKDVPGVGEAAATFEDADSRYLASAKVLDGTPVMVMWVGAKDYAADQLTGMVKTAIDRL